MIAAPLQELLKKSTHFRWDDEQEDAFVELNEALCKARVHAYTNPVVPYIVDTDASNLAIGAQNQEMFGQCSCQTTDVL